MPQELIVSSFNRYTARKKKLTMKLEQDAALTSLDVLMAVCHRDDVHYLKKALQSIRDQSLAANNVVLVIDGPVPEDIVLAIGEFRNVLPISVIQISENGGLANALNLGLSYCTSCYVARMDPDDIAMPQRFFEQVSYLTKHPEVSVCGSWIMEFSEITTDTYNKKLPVQHNDILKYARYRNPVAHPSVIFRRDDVVAAGGYPHFRTSQDFALWSLMLKQGYLFHNLPQILLKFRTTSLLQQRRGLSYFIGEIKVFIFKKNIGQISFSQLLISIIIYSIIRLSPHFFKKILYEKLR